MQGDHIRILCIASYFLPGFKGGGPIRSIANLAKSLPDRFSFEIFTRDRDLGDARPYSGIECDTWGGQADAQVFYASPKRFGIAGLKSAVQGRGYDILYVNSLYGVSSSLLPILWNGSWFGPKLPVLIAPKGGLTTGALAKKPVRKRVFLTMARLMRLYGKAHWHVSSAQEAEDVLRQFPKAVSQIHVAPDLAVASDPADGFTKKQRNGKFRLIFLSRISPMKNLLGLIAFLKNTNHEIKFDIYGPIEDALYWKECQVALGNLPPNIDASYLGQVEPDHVSDVFAKYDLFALPTFGENFGHVILESLQAGTPVLISDQTPWCADPHGAVMTLSLDHPYAWSQQVDAFAAVDADQYQNLTRAARRYAETYLADDRSLDLHVKMFDAVYRGASDKLLSGAKVS